MCLLCGDAGATRHGISLTERPAHVLGGAWWSGSFAEADAGALHPLIGAMRDFSAARAAVWKSPIVGLSVNRRADGFDYFAGIAVEEDEVLPSGFVRMAVPEMVFASSWHGAGDGEVAAHYGAMAEWLEGEGRARNTAFCDRREEFPHDVDLSGTPTLRLMLPIDPGWT